MDQETIEGLLKCLDEAIVKREKNYETLDSRYKNENGHILSSEYDEYKERKNKVEEKFRSNAIDYQQKLDNICKRVRKKQPALIELREEYVNKNERFPRRIALGKYRVQYENLDFFVPKMFEFPFKKPMYICDDGQMELLHKILLRLMYALPSDKQEYYIFDPMGLGKSVWNFNRLFSNEKIFPQKKIMSKAIELKEALKDVMEYMRSLYAGTFDLQTNCEDWDSYNRWIYSQKKIKKMLPYKVFLFLNVPDGMDADCFEMFRKLLIHSEKCGFLVLFSFNEVLLEAEDSKMKAQELLLRQCVEISLPLHSVLDKNISELSFEKLNITSIGEKFPDDRSFDALLRDFDKTIKNNTSSMFSFDDMLSQESLFSKKSSEGLSIPCGYTTSGGSEVLIEIGDRYPHYLIGGTTGSGKSNLLHNIIVSSCWNYDPEELRVYLLDFKEGVEFSRYSDPILRHAELVATEADTEYGISVLDHLIGEKTRRYSAFKDSNCKDITAYKKKNPTQIMPRILVIIDEFQVLFEGADKDRTIETLTTLAKQGRACGIHLVLATQSLKGIDFGNLAPQFSGRIALKCSPEDSKMLLGGITSNNEDASELEIPYVILNTSQGSKAGNVKYAIPEAKTDSIGIKLDELNAESDRQRIHTNTKVFEGQTFPNLPEEASFAHEKGIVLTLGEVISYDAQRLDVSLVKSPENNILLCGHDEQMKVDFLNEILLSAFGCKDCDELVYIGEKVPECYAVVVGDSRFVSYSNITDFIDANKEYYFNKRRILILDNLNLTKEIGFPPAAYGAVSDYAKSLKTYWDDANKYSNHFIALYDGLNRVKASGIPLMDFKYRVGYSLNSDEKNQLLGNTSFASKRPEKRRAFFADNLVIEAWFRPYEKIGKDSETWKI